MLPSPFRETHTPTRYPFQKQGMKHIILTISFVLVIFVLQAQPGRVRSARPNLQPVKRIYLANDDHTDYMWSGDEETYKKAFS